MLKPVARSFMKCTSLFLFLSSNVKSEDAISSTTKFYRNAYLFKNSAYHQQGEKWRVNTTAAEQKSIVFVLRTGQSAVHASQQAHYKSVPPIEPSVQQSNNKALLQTNLQTKLQTKFSVSKSNKVQKSQQQRLHHLQQQAYQAAIDALSQSSPLASPSSLYQPIDLPVLTSAKVTKIDLPAPDHTAPASITPLPTSPEVASIDLPTPMPDPLWCATAGKTLKEAVRQWERVAGWSVQWNSDYDYPILAEVCFKGSFDQVMGDVIDAYKQAEYPFYLELYPKQQLAVISN